MARPKRKESVDPRWVSIATAAERMEIGDKSVRRLIQSGELAATRVGPRMIRIRESDLNALLSRPLR